MFVNVAKKDIEFALGLYRAANLKKSRRDYKREVLQCTRTFGFKSLSYKEAKKVYNDTQLPFYHLVKDSCYGHRIWENADSVIQELELILKHEATENISLDMRFVRALDKYLPNKKRKLDEIT